MIIAGTGSTCRYLNKRGELFGVGGHGHLIGDGGSGFWIVQRYQSLGLVEVGNRDRKRSYRKLKKTETERFLLVIPALILKFYFLLSCLF